MGIDPGLTGGVAFVTSCCAKVYPMPIVAGEVSVSGLLKLISENEPTEAVVERAQAMPKQGVVSIASYMKNYGKIIGTLECVPIPYREVTPQSWKKVVLAGTAKDKEAAIKYCIKKFPAASLMPTERSKKPSDGMADALCIADSGFVPI